jgi:hypothetical protein
MNNKRKIKKNRKTRECHNGMLTQSPAFDTYRVPEEYSLSERQIQKCLTSLSRNVPKLNVHQSA